MFGHGNTFTLAIVSSFSDPDPNLLARSFNTVYVAEYRGQDQIEVFDVHDIKSVIAMVPDFQAQDNGKIITPRNQFFLVEEPCQEIASSQNEEEHDEGESDSACT